ncbi:hypothetical protein [Microbacterium sp. ZW T5_56]|uniref:hypothetical protein n=1 Tax=Microbacterium sp. ZW T5_56 TaxID=3378081 RepID=UPI0038552809
MNKLGINGDQVAEFVQAARTLPAEAVTLVESATRGKDVRDAQRRVLKVRWSAAHSSALTSVAADLIQELRRSYPPTSNTAERFTLNSVTLSLKIAVLALAARPKLDEETVGLVVDPFTDILGYDWRSTGVSSTAGKDTP